MCMWHHIMIPLNILIKPVDCNSSCVSGRFLLPFKTFCTPKRMPQNFVFSVHCNFLSGTNLPIMWLIIQSKGVLHFFMNVSSNQTPPLIALLSSFLPFRQKR